MPSPSLSDVIHPLTTSGRLALLVGAGISLDSPSNLMDGGSFTRGVIHHVCPADLDRDTALSLLRLPDCPLRRPGEYIRFETLMMSLSQERVDADLKVLASLGESREPNRNHYLLAALLAAGAIVMTTNFDCLIEIAFARLHGGRKLRVVSADADFPTQAPPQSAEPTLWKLHGSSPDDGSVQATITAVLATSMTIRKRSFLKDTLRTCHLVIAGYSGSDDLDLNPVIADIDSPQRLLWIQHSSGPVRVVQDRALLPNCAALSDRDLIGRDRVFFMATRRGKRPAGAVLYVEAPTSTVLDILARRYDPSFTEPAAEGPPPARGDTLAAWAKGLPSTGSAPYSFIAFLAGNGAFRPRMRRLVEAAQQRIPVLRRSPIATPMQKLSQAIEDFNALSEHDHSGARLVRETVLALLPTLAREDLGTAHRLLACMDWNESGQGAGEASFRRAVLLDREIGNLRPEFHTLNTWRDFAGLTQWDDLFPQFLSEEVLNHVSPDYIERQRAQARRLSGTLFPEPELFRLNELAAMTGLLPALWTSALLSLHNFVDAEGQLGFIALDRGERLVRFAVDMGDVEGEAQATVAMGRLYAGVEQPQLAATEFRRVAELNRVLQRPYLEEALYALPAMDADLNSPTREELRNSMWGSAE